MFRPFHIIKNTISTNVAKEGGERGQFHFRGLPIPERALANSEIPGTPYLILGSLDCMTLFHGCLADFLDGFVRPEGPLPLGVVERLALDESDDFFGFGQKKHLIHLFAPFANFSRLLSLSVRTPL